MGAAGCCLAGWHETIIEQVSTVISLDTSTYVSEIAGICTVGHIIYYADHGAHRICAYDTITSMIIIAAFID
jgi:uncharacterized ParB-like nuclease family protein